jgi:hypothetical protein
MARRGDGIYQRERTWWLDFVHRGERHVVRIGSNISRTVAKEIAQVECGRILRVEAGIGKKLKDILFDESRTLFLSWAATNKKRSTARFYSDRLATLAKTFEGKRVSEITANAIEDYKRTRVDGERGRVAVNRDLSTLRALYNRMIDLGDTKGRTPSRRSPGEAVRGHPDAVLYGPDGGRPRRRRNAAHVPTHFRFAARDGGEGRRTIQELMGHRDINMAIRYTHPSDEHKVAAVRTALVPPEFPNAIPKAVPEADAAVG